MKLLWLTDIHLNFLGSKKRKKFYETLSEGDAVLISGDIAEAPSITVLLQEMATNIQKPIYFVLGNHDYYRGNIEIVRTEMCALTKATQLLHWLPACEPILLEEQTVLVGQDGWADGRYGDYHNSGVVLNDSLLIGDLFQQKILNRSSLLKKMQQLADEDAKQLDKKIEQAITLHHPRKIIVLTHVPPFKEACLYQGKISNEDWLPYYASKATGDVLMALAQKYSAIEFLVLCGHTHSRVCYNPLDNLIVKTGWAEYGQPELQDMDVMKQKVDIKDISSTDFESCLAFFLERVAPEQEQFVTGHFFKHGTNYAFAVLDDLGGIIAAIRYCRQKIGVEQKCEPVEHQEGYLYEAKINVFAVAPEYRGKGIGTALQQFVLKHAADKGCYQVASYSTYDKVANYKIKFNLGFCCQPEQQPNGVKGCYFLKKLSR